MQGECSAVIELVSACIPCQTVQRFQAAGWLEDAGYEVLVNVEGGFSAWARDDSLPVEV